MTAGAAPTEDTVGEPLDGAAVRKDFPLLQREVHWHRIVYLDSASTSQKPRPVLDAMQAFYEHAYANVHRGAYQLAAEADAAYEGARAAVARFVNASSAREVVFTKNATEAINLVAHSWGRTHLGQGDTVLLTHLEHHANIVPWHMLAAERGLQLRWIPLTPDGRLDLTDLDRLLDGVALVGVSAMSNVLGTFPPVRHIADAAHAVGATVLVDACQYVPHHPTDVQALGGDFVAFSSHKMCGPSGVGVLWGRQELLDAMPPFLGGGNMILDVRLDGFVPDVAPGRFEAGTPPIAEVVGLGAAVDYLSALGMDRVRAHERTLTAYALDRLRERFPDTVTVYGPDDVDTRGGTLSFALAGVHPHDVSQVLDQSGVCVRAGHHCAKPLMRLLGVSATARASVYVYNDTDDVDILCDALDAARDVFAL